MATDGSCVTWGAVMDEMMSAEMISEQDAEMVAALPPDSAALSEYSNRAASADQVVAAGPASPNQNQTAFFIISSKMRGMTPGQPQWEGCAKAMACAYPLNRLLVVDDADDLRAQAVRQIAAAVADAAAGNFAREGGCCSFCCCGCTTAPRSVGGSFPAVGQCADRGAPDLANPALGGLRWAEKSGAPVVFLSQALVALMAIVCVLLA